MTKSHFFPISPLELQWGGGGSSSKGRDTYVGKTHFLTLISIGPRTKNPLWAICYSKIWFLWNCLMYTYSIQYMIYIYSTCILQPVRMFSTFWTCWRLFSSIADSWGSSRCCKYPADLYKFWNLAKEVESFWMLRIATQILIFGFFKSPIIWCLQSKNKNQSKLKTSLHLGNKG